MAVESGVSRKSRGTILTPFGYHFDLNSDKYGFDPVEKVVLLYVLPLHLLSESFSLEEKGESS
jgi:hypothetical protein